jgi:hypothetical protein
MKQRWILKHHERVLIDGCVSARGIGDMGYLPCDQALAVVELIRLGDEVQPIQEGAAGDQDHERQQRR